VSALSKTLGQLIVLSVVQSQQLQRQQVTLDSQQTATRTLQNKVLNQHGVLAEHQQVLHLHGDEIQQVLHQLVEIRNELISSSQHLGDVVQDARKTREELQAQTQQALTEATSRVETACEWVQSIADAHDTQVGHLRNALNADTEARDQAEQLLADELALLQRQVDQEHTSVEGLSDQFAQARLAQEELNTRLTALTEERATERARMQSTMRKLTLGIVGASGLALVGLGLAATRYIV
jgi:chromosome segregation ATPase